MFAIDYKDLGTPASEAPVQVTVEIDGVPVTVPDGTEAVLRLPGAADETVAPGIHVRTIPTHQPEGELVG